MMTEEEAKTKWCPFARDIMGNGGNRMAYGGGEEDGPDNDDCAVQYAAEMASMHPCIGSFCAAWRWVPREPSGYCGLAGKPTP